MIFFFPSRSCERERVENVDDPLVHARSYRSPPQWRLTFCLLGGFSPLGTADMPALWAERTKATVAVEFVVETEIDRRPGVSYGMVIDTKGTIILPSSAIDSRVAPSQLKEFKIYTPDDPVSSSGEYLGQ